VLETCDIRDEGSRERERFYRLENEIKLKGPKGGVDPYRLVAVALSLTVSTPLGHAT
jgi:hypothetical protein